jgi:hypothetical protein
MPASSGVTGWPSGQGGKRLCTVAFGRGRSIFAGIEFRPVGRRNSYLDLG